MKTFLKIVKRNVKLFFKEKGLFFTSLITPLILLVLYATFLSSVNQTSFVEILKPQGITLDGKTMNGLVGGQLLSSLLAVSCVTISFSSNMLMVQDKVSGARKDMLISPVKRSTLAFSYYTASLVSTLMICLVAFGACAVYLSIIGWFLSFTDVLLLLLDIFLLVMFGTALSSVINYFLSSQGHISAVGSIVSSCYGFICGAYMPIANFGAGLQKVLMFLPGTYGTSLIRNHALGGVFNHMATSGMPTDAIEGLKRFMDCNLSFFGNNVAISTMYLVLGGTIALLIGAYVLINVLSKKKS
jgi:multidrug/hemolysin transport system permease protein